MRAAQIREYKQPYHLTRVPIPSVRPDELLVKVHAAGFCHSDVQVLNGQFSSPLPLIPSHEPAGEVVQVGNALSDTSTSWQVGERVGVLNFKSACRSCTGCSIAKRRYEGEADPRFCEKRETAGFQHDGAFAEYLVADPSTTVKLPDTLSYTQAAPLMCAGATVWGALEKATERVEAGAFVAIVGIGGLGHLGVQFAKSQGFCTIAIDSRQEGRDLAQDVPEALMPNYTIDSTSSNAAEEILKHTNGEGIAAAIVCTDSIEANAWTLRQLGIGGVMVALGLPPERWQFDSDIMVFRELTIKGSYVASAESTRRMMEAVGAHGIRSHVTVKSFDDIPQIVDAYHDKSFKGRLVVEIGDQ
ncbi:alcohol dehydrogenase groES-like domain-containing protein [Sarocladium implicatum]|nr:alcohol dehydrogenase groES-like domain-containing protein [Sarocladium implicatum]